jgi:glycosyltransferase involved in cell wall biosynthesis
MATQESRWDFLQFAVADFLRQDWPQRELVIVHAGGDGFHVRLLAFASEYASIHCTRVPTGTALGEMRNAAIDAAGGEWVCQWDDDDRHHPERLRRQFEHAQHAGAACSFLTDQLHLFLPSGDATWDDWQREAYPMNLIQATLLARRDVLGRYPAVNRGEDTAQFVGLLRAGHTLARLSDRGWLYVYVTHTDNVSGYAHHRAIADAKAHGAAHLLNNAGVLRQRAAEYAPPLPTLYFRHAGGVLQIG